MPLVRDVTKLNFYSGDPIDKGVSSGTVTFTNDGNTGTTSQIAKIQTDTIPNPYGKKCFVRFVWSLDGKNFNTPDTQFLYGFTIHVTTPSSTTPPLQGLQAAVSVGASDSTLYFVTGNGFHGNVTRATSGSADSYTPISQTFTFKYELIEIL